MFLPPSGLFNSNFHLGVVGLLSGIIAESGHSTLRDEPSGSDSKRGRSSTSCTLLRFLDASICESSSRANLRFGSGFARNHKKCPRQARAFFMAPEAGLEPATIALTGRCSTIELLRNIVLLPKDYNLLGGLKSSYKYAKLPP